MRVLLPPKVTRWMGLLLLLTCTAAQAQFAGWRAYTDGSSVSGLALEGQKVWVSTYGGLAVVDAITGTSTYYNHVNSGLPTNPVRQVAVDRRGHKWLATGAGLVRFNGSTWTVYDRTNSPLTNNEVNAVAVDEQDRLWVSGTIAGGSGVARFDGTNWTVYNASNASPALGEYVLTMRPGPGGTMWFGTYANQIGDGGHLIRFDGTTWQAYHHTTSGLPPADIVQVTPDATGKVWVATAGRGLAVFDGSTWQRYHTGNSGLQTNNVTHVAIGPTGKAWIGTAGGLYTYDGTTWTHYSRLNSGLATSYVTMVVLDAAGNPYVGTAPGAVTSGGLYHFDGSTWRNFATSNSGLLYNSEITNMVVDRSNTLWLASRDRGLGKSGLLQLNGSTWTAHTIYNSPLPDDMLNTVALSPDGSLWMGTGFSRVGATGPYRGGLARLDGGTWTLYHVNENGMPLAIVNSIAFEGAGTRWLGTSYGLVRFDQNGFTHWHTGNSGLPANEVKEVAVDAQGRKWLATYGGGLVRFDGSTWQAFNTQNSSLPSNGVNSVLVAADGSIWVGTLQGVARLHNNAWTVYTASSGLPASGIRTVRQAPDGKIWVGAGAAGAAVFDGGSWQAFTAATAPLANSRVDAFAFQGSTVWLGGNNLLAYDNVVTSSRQARTSKTTVGLLYPNPTSGMVHVHAEASQYQRAEVINALGQQVRTVPVQGTSLDLTGLPTGLYQVRLHGRGGTHTTKLLVR